MQEGESNFLAYRALIANGVTQKGQKGRPRRSAKELAGDEDLSQGTLPATHATPGRNGDANRAPSLISIGEDAKESLANTTVV